MIRSLLPVRGDVAMHDSTTTNDNEMVGSARARSSTIFWDGGERAGPVLNNILGPLPESLNSSKKITVLSLVDIHISVKTKQKEPPHHSPQIRKKAANG